mmetsp:Transcript_25716/g.79128  ORF Transcript_25716/g.79128 Transcript_25716/m.79128 type:complete len:129 (+) Transcript_25716:1883-2269(+)
MSGQMSKSSVPLVQVAFSQGSTVAGNIETFVGSSVTFPNFKASANEVGIGDGSGDGSGDGIGPEIGGNVELESSSLVRVVRVLTVAYVEVSTRSSIVGGLLSGAKVEVGASVDKFSVASSTTRSDDVS